jgi:hypothetical protein
MILSVIHRLMMGMWGGAGPRGGWVAEAVVDDQAI